VIARIWTARTTRAQAPTYAAYLEAHVFAKLGEIDGYVRALLLQRDVGEDVEVQVITFWRSLDAIRAFAGDDAEAAVVTEAAAALLTGFDRRARHFEVVLGQPVD
jgi:heme-degrading monooxygenase HmoA